MDDFDDHFLKKDRKYGKQQRKIASAKDRSKYKKTDVDKLKKQQSIPEEIQGHLIRGRVISIASEGVIVDADGTIYQCVLRGKFKKEKTQQKNLVIVGDFVGFEKHGDEGVISQIEPRKTILSRADNLSQRKKQMIAANIDQVLITTSVVNPQLKQTLIDRYIIASEKGDMKPIVVVNKIDLLGEKEYPDDPFLEDELDLYQEFVRAYAIAGIQVISVSSFTGKGMEELKEAMKDKVSVFSGQSGVGKSSLINQITGYNLKIGGIVEKTKKGSHTTSTANLLPLPFGGWCIDTPGIKSFGIWDLQKDELLAYFPEIMEQGKNCKFPNCTHMHEPGCSLPEAMEEGLVSPLRYDSYCSLLLGLDEEHLRR